MRPFAFIRTVVIFGTLAVCLLLVGLLIYSSHVARVESERWRTQQGAAPNRARGDGANATLIPVLCHHYIREDSRPRDVPAILGAIVLNLPFVDNINPWTQTESSFEKQMKLLRDRGYTAVGFDDVAAWKIGQKTLPKKSVVITFDDGDRSVLDFALPILKKYRMRATLFIVTDEVGQAWDGVEGLTWKELRYLESTGVFHVESHSNDLHYKIKTRRGHLPIALAMSSGAFVPPGETPWQRLIVEDLVESRRQIARHLGHDSRHLAWPYGTANATVDSLAALAGFRTRLTLSERVNSPSEVRRVVYRSAPPKAVGANRWDGSHAMMLSLATSDTDTGNASATRVWVDGHMLGGGFELSRFTVTSRTSIRTFSRFLEGKGLPRSRLKMFFGFAAK